MNGQENATPEVILYTTSWCGWCRRTRQLFNDKGVRFEDIDVEQVPGAREQMRTRSGGRSTVPQVFVGGRHLGGYDDTKALDDKGELDRLLHPGNA